MKVLIIGSGGREHTLCLKVTDSIRVSQVFCAPGNAGTEKIAENIDIDANDVDKLLEFALKESIDLTIVGPEEPLVLGIVDRFEEKDLRIFGVNEKSAKLEGSKIYAKKFMEEYEIPTAKYREYSNIDEAIKGLDEFDFPLVIKADGLCLGKGVIICQTKEEALETLETMMTDKVFGSAGESLIIEEFLEGVEASLLCLVSQGRLIPMESAKDYKKIYDNDEGENTGGVGCYSPSPLFDKKLKRKIHQEILTKIETGFEYEYLDYKGIIFVGLMITDDGIKVLEFNVRFGDPETQAIIPRLEDNIVDILQKTIDGNLRDEDLNWKDESSVTLVATSKGYPGKYEVGKEITGLEDLDEDVILVHHGTKVENSKTYTNGGRVLSITALGDTLEEARKKAYDNMKKVDFEGIYYRSDIGKL